MRKLNSQKALLQFPSIVEGARRRARIVVQNGVLQESIHSRIAVGHAV